MLITADIIRSLNPCHMSFEQGLKDYPSWSGTFEEFLDLKKISDADKIWVFSRLPFSDEVKREFAFACASRAVDGYKNKEVKEFFTLILFQYEAGCLFEYNEEYRAADWAADRAADSAAYNAADWAANRAANRAADRAANSAADWAAETKTQVEFLRELVKEK